MHCGTGVMVEEHGELFGSVANVAYEMGEDICENASVLVSEAVRDTVRPCTPV